MPLKYICPRIKTFFKNTFSNLKNSVTFRGPPKTEVKLAISLAFKRKKTLIQFGLQAGRPDEFVKIIAQNES
jgi:hypothetical protein